MYRSKLYLLSIFLLLTSLSFSQLNKVLITPEKVLYKSIDEVDLNLYFYRPLDFDNSKTYNCIIFFHGGAWNTGDYKQFQRHAMYFASRGMIAVSAEYRITSKHGSTPFQSLEDAKSAIRFVRSNAKYFSVNPQRIAVSGGSAGGHLAAATSTIIKYDNVRENTNVSSKPNLLILFNPILDTSPNAWGYGSFMRRVGNRKTDNPVEISPIHHLSPKSPPTIILTGTNDNKVPIEMINDYREKMNFLNIRCDVVFYEGAEHSFFNRNKYFIETVLESDNFLKSNWYLEGPPTIKEQYN